MKLSFQVVRFLSKPSFAMVSPPMYGRTFSKKPLLMGEETFSKKRFSRGHVLVKIDGEGLLYMGGLMIR